MSVDTNLGDLRARLRAAGAFETRELRSWLELALLGSLLAAALAAIVIFGWRAALFAIPAAAVLATSIAMYGHEGSHRSFSSSPLRNAMLVHFAFPMFSGLGAAYWRDKHDRKHHAHPNVESLDPDLNPFPFAFSRGGHDASGPGARWFQRTFQRWLFWPMATLMTTGMRRSSVMYLARQPRNRGWWIEVACLAVHYIGWLVVPSLIWGVVPTIGVYLSLWALVGVCLALVFAPAHMGLPIVTGANHDWQHQLATTQNLELPRALSPFFVGLDYQVEHHLFPKIPHANLRRAAAITRAWCQERGIEHQSVPYLQALVSAAGFMAAAWSRDADYSGESVAVVVGIVDQAA
jgi:fatty acid desaturase